MSNRVKRLEKAEKHLQKGKVKAALQEYLALLQEDPANEAVCQTAADLCVTLGRKAEAVGLLSGLLDRQLSAGQDAKAGITYKRLSRIGTPKLDQHLRCADVFKNTNKNDALDAYAAAVRLVWELFEKDPSCVQQVAAVINSLLKAELVPNALALARKLQEHQQHADKRREYIVLIKEVAEKHPPRVEFLEYLVELFNSANREQDYCPR